MLFISSQRLVIVSKSVAIVATGYRCHCNNYACDDDDDDDNDYDDDNGGDDDDGDDG